MKKTFIRSILFAIFTILVVIVLNLSINKEVETNMSQEINFVIVEDNGIPLKIPINKIPEIKHYLEGVQDKEIEISRMRGIFLKKEKTESFILLEYGCGTKMCDSVLIRKKGKEITTIKLFFGIFQDYVFSPNEDNILLVYGVNEGPINRNFIKVVNLSEMIFIESQSKELMNEFMGEPNWPILEYKWIDNDSISIKIPDTPSSNIEVLEKWFKSKNKNTITVIIKLQ